MTKMICHLTAMYSVTINLYFVDAYLTPLTFKNQKFTFLYIKFNIKLCSSQIAINFLNS